MVVSTAGSVVLKTVLVASFLSIGHAVGPLSLSASSTLSRSNGRQEIMFEKKGRVAPRVQQHEFAAVDGNPIENTKFDETISLRGGHIASNIGSYMVATKLRCWIVSPLLLRSCCFIDGFIQLIPLVTCVYVGSPCLDLNRNSSNYIY